MQNVGTEHLWKCFIPKSILLNIYLTAPSAPKRGTGQESKGKKINKPTQWQCFVCHQAHFHFCLLYQFI